ncbi:Pyrethroid hydrolase [Legionella santicrucis]|uniref:Pyrethroid hydrolase n=1 Tax=Legionella santicrucis TaxID=45074 RepID=A0A0W0YSL7_9GAMM|nr:alpha/beta fold hydrolase [Legionella santicrucis]KTD59881.1 Pyrethroid hydrolase [Legionella santicrucis]
MNYVKRLCSIFLSLFLTSYAMASTNKSTLLLVHGALFTSAGWQEVQSHLQNLNYNVVTIDVPGRAGDGIIAKDVTLSMATEKLCKVANLQRGKVVLVGHSQGGALITKALDKCGSKVKALVYLTAVMPLNGEKAFDDLNESDAENFNADTFFDEENAIFHINYNGPIKETFMADVTPEQYERALHNMVPEPANISEEILNYPIELFNAIPKFYIETTEDKIISIATQRKIERKTKFEKIYIMNTSHSPFLSNSKELANHLIDIMDNF